MTSTFKKHVLFKEKIAWVLMENYFRIQKQFLDEFLFLNNQEKMKNHENCNPENFCEAKQFIDDPFETKMPDK